MISKKDNDVVGYPWDMAGTARRMWALDGAWLTMRRDGLVDGASPEPVRIPVPSFLVEHDDGLALIDSGFDPAAIDDPVGTYGEIGRQIEFSAGQRVDVQLEELGFATGDVTHVVVSHVHFDHTGSLTLFPGARFLLGRGDAPAVRGEDSPVTEISRQADLEPLRDAAWEYLDGDHDVFGDGALVVLALPGHTPGNTGTLVRLPGRTFLLTGDTAHLRGALEHPRPMGADTDPEQAVASLHRVNALAAEYGAETWVVHDPDDWVRLRRL